MPARRPAVSDQFLQAVFEDVQALVDQRIADVKRWQEADNVAACSAAQQRQAAFVGLAYQQLGQLGIGLLGITTP